MRISGYQTKTILNEYRINTCKFKIADSPEGAADAADEIGFPVTLKPQLNKEISGRIKEISAKNRDEAASAAEKLLNTHPSGTIVERISITEMPPVDKIYSLILQADSRSKQLRLLLGTVPSDKNSDAPESADTGFYDILPVPHPGLPRAEEVEKFIAPHFTSVGARDQALEEIIRFIELFKEKDCISAGIYPYALLQRGNLAALDGYLEIDKTALYRQRQIQCFSKTGKTDLSIECVKNICRIKKNEKDTLNFISDSPAAALVTADIVCKKRGLPGNFIILPAVTAKTVKDTLYSLYGYRDVLSEESEDKGKNKIGTPVIICISEGIKSCSDAAKGIISASGKLKVPIIPVFFGADKDKAAEIIGKTGLNAAKSISNAVEVAISAVSRNQKKEIPQKSSAEDNPEK